MKYLRNTVIGICIMFCLSAAIVWFWLYTYDRDLPSLSELDAYNPTARAEVHLRAPDVGEAVVHVIPAAEFGKHLPNAVVAAEGEADKSSPIRATVEALLRNERPHPMYSLRLASGMGMGGRAFRRQLDELRLADRIYHRYSPQQILTIYMNRVDLGEGARGMENGAFRYFGKRARDVSIDEAALLAGLIHAPSYDSPIQHPERAVERRNQVISAMEKLGFVSTEEAKSAFEVPLVVKKDAESPAAYDWKRCQLKAIRQGTSAGLRISPGSLVRNMPVIAFEVLESGAIRNAVISRSSGVAEIDKYALESVRSMKYEERPIGCGVIEEAMAMHLDFR